MSSRQLRRVRPICTVDGDCDLEVEESEKSLRHSFGELLCSDDEDSDSSSLKSDDNATKPANMVSSSTKYDCLNLPERHDAIDCFDCPTSMAEINQSKTIIATVEDLMQLNAHDFDIDVILEFRFGIGAGKHKRTATSKKRKQKQLLFGIVTHCKAKSFVSGGLRMKRSSVPTKYINLSAKRKWFELEWSVEYRQLNIQLLAIQRSGDVQSLITFAAKYPYNLDGLLELADVFLKCGEFDKAKNVLKRCLFTVESLFLVDFTPTRGLSCLDNDTVENKIIFNAIYRYLQLASHLDCSSTCASIATMLLSLNPMEDPCNILLLLDHFYLASKKFELILRFMGLSEYGVIGTVDEAASHALVTAARLQCDTISHTLGIPNLWSLSNWVYSLALALYLNQPQGAASNTALRDVVLRQALTCWPVVMATTVKEGAGLLLKSARSNHISSCFASRATGASECEQVVACMYVTRTAQLWRRDDVQSWLMSHAEQIAGEPPMLVLDSRSSHTHHLDKYIVFSPTDFDLEYHRIPGNFDANEVGLIDPEELFGAQQAALTRAHQDELLGGADSEVAARDLKRVTRWLKDYRHGLMDDFGMSMRDADKVMSAVREATLVFQLVQARQAGLQVSLDETFAQYKHDLDKSAQEIRSRVVTKGNLSADLPLMQLFWQTLLPWNSVDFDRT